MKWLPLILLACLAQGSERTIEMEWSQYVHRFTREVDSFRQSMSARGEWDDALSRRVAVAEAALAVNAEFISMLLEKWNNAKREHLDDDDDDGNLGKVAWESSSSAWRSCEQTEAYSTIDELLAHLYRDYGGSTSKHATRVIDEVNRLVKLLGHDESRSPSILLLGAGVGGVAAAIAQALSGASITATECSSIFGATSLAALSEKWNGTIVPWASNFGGALYGDERDQFQRSVVSFPGPDGLAASNVAFVAADAMNARSDAGGPVFDIVVTHYFIDAAAKSRSRGILHVLDRVAKLTAAGGFWVNVGPLHYHLHDVFPKLSITNVLTYMLTAHSFSVESAVDVLEPEDYSRPQETSLFTNAHKAASFVLRRGRDGGAL